VRRDWRSRPAPAVEAESRIRGCDVTVDSLSGLFGYLELDWLARFPLSHGCAIDRVTLPS
jgi:hypothetical protein